MTHRVDDDGQVSVAEKMPSLTPERVQDAELVLGWSRALGRGERISYEEYVEGLGLSDQVQ